MKSWNSLILLLAALSLTLAALALRELSAQTATATTPEMKPYTEAIPGTQVSFEMTPVRGGTFVMGSPATEPGRSADEGPAHEVTLRPFWIGKYEVRWDEYDLFAFSRDLPTAAGEKAAPAEKPAAAKGVDAFTRPTPPYSDETFGYAREGNPVISMTHHAAMEFCAWLSARTGKTYRLPTEAEWEYACRAGAKSAYSFGNDPAPLGEHAWYKENAGEKPNPVGKKKPNAWGLYDMHGNVAEWVLDRYSKSFYARLAEKLSALAPVLLPGEEEYPQVVRGGSWDDPPARLRSAARAFSREEWNKRDPQNPQSIWWLTEAITVGFRVVRPLQEQDNLKGFRSPTKKGAGTFEEK